MCEEVAHWRGWVKLSGKTLAPTARRHKLISLFVKQNDSQTLALRKMLMCNTVFLNHLYSTHEQ